LINKKKKKIALLLIGPPGSGKTSSKMETLKSLDINIKDMVDIDPDELLINYFKNDNRCRKLLSEINDEIIKRTINNNYNFILDRTGYDYEWYYNLIKEIKDKGYKIYLSIVLNNINTSIKRVKLRSETTQRNDIQENIIKKIYSRLETNIPKYINLKCEDVDEIFVYDNKNNLKLLYKSKCIDNFKHVECFVNKSKYFIDKDSNDTLYSSIEENCLQGQKTNSIINYGRKKTTSAKSLSAKSLNAKSLSARSLSAKSLNAKSLSARSLSAKSLSAKSLSAKSLSAKSLSARSTTTRSARRKSTRHTINSRSNNNFSRIPQLSPIPEVSPIPQ